MSRFEFRPSEIDHALHGLEQIKIETSNIIFKLMNIQETLEGQQSEVVEAIRSEVNKCDSKALKQLIHLNALAYALKEVKSEVNKAEFWASIRVSGMPYIADFLRTLYDIGWKKTSGKSWNGMLLSMTSGIAGVLPVISNPKWWTAVEGGGIGVAGGIGASILGTDIGISASGELLKTTGKATHSLNFDLQKRTVGMEAAAEGSVSLVSGKVTGKIGPMESTLSADVGKVSGKGSVKCALFEKGKFNPALEAEVKATAEGVTITDDVRLGNERYNVHAEGKGTLGYAEAKAGVKVNKNSVSAEAKAGAYAARGKVKTGFTLFGVNFDITGEGGVGGASIGGEFHVSGNSIEIGGEAGLLAGLGIKIKIDW